MPITYSLGYALEIETQIRQVLHFDEVHNNE